jgi:hypothetical protein
MKHLSRLAATSVITLTGAMFAQIQPKTVPEQLNSGEIPLPVIHTSMKPMPGVDQLPTARFIGASKPSPRQVLMPSDKTRQNSTSTTFNTAEKPERLHAESVATGIRGLKDCAPWPQIFCRQTH